MMLNWTAIMLSFRLASCVSILLLLIALPLGYWITFSPRRWKFLVEAIVAMPLVLPPTLQHNSPAAGQERGADRVCVELRAHTRRVWDCADGRRQYSRSHADGFNRHL